MLKLIKDEKQRTKDELAMWVRVLLLDELVHNNGKQLDANLIGDIATAVVERFRDSL